MKMFVVRYWDGDNQISQSFTKGESVLATDFAKLYAQKHGTAALIVYTPEGASVRKIYNRTTEKKLRKAA